MAFVKVGRINNLSRVAICIDSQAMHGMQSLPEESFSDDEDFDTSGTAPPLAPEVVRTKVMSLDPMSIQDAMDQVNTPSFCCGRVDETSWQGSIRVFITFRHHLSSAVWSPPSMKCILQICKAFLRQEQFRRDREGEM